MSKDPPLLFSNWLRYSGFIVYRISNWINQTHANHKQIRNERGAGGAQHGLRKRNDNKTTKKKKEEAEEEEAGLYFRLNVYE